MTSALHRNIIPLIVATGLFMENLDATVILTSLPAMASDFGIAPANLSVLEPPSLSPKEGR